MILPGSNQSLNHDSRMRISAGLGDPWRRATPAGLRRRVATASRVWDTSGAAGIRAAIASRLRCAARRLRRWWYADHAWLGRFVELRGNWVRLDGCRFDVSHPQIPRGLRTRLLRGRYERSERTLLNEWLDPGAPVIELGGGIGIVAALINRRLHDPARHLVIEANPYLIPVLEQQKLATSSGFTVEHAALDYSGAATARLHLGNDFISSRLDAGVGETVVVPAVTLHDVLRRYPWTGVTLVCDIEGVETELVENDGEVLSRHCDTLIMEVHPEFRSPAQCEKLPAVLEELGFQKVATVRKVHAFRHRRLQNRAHPSG